MSNLDLSQLANLSEPERKEMQTFIEQESGRLKMQNAISEFTERCFPKCLTTGSSVQKDQLSASDQNCLANCVGRYLDVCLLPPTLPTVTNAWHDCNLSRSAVGDCAGLLTKEIFR